LLIARRPHQPGVDECILDSGQITTLSLARTEGRRQGDDGQHERVDAQRDPRGLVRRDQDGTQHARQTAGDHRAELPGNGDPEITVLVAEQFGQQGALRAKHRVDADADGHGDHHDD
jgi:hypothetical protein